MTKKRNYERGYSEARKEILEFLYQLNSCLGNDVDKAITKKIKELEKTK